MIPSFCVAGLEEQFEVVIVCQESAYLGSTGETFDDTVVSAIETTGLEHFIL
jgi:hypothetical protein